MAKKILTPEEALAAMFGGGNDSAEATSVGESDIVELNISDLKPYPNQPFKMYSQEQLEELADSIKAVGVLHPVIVRKVGNEYQILAGHNRRRAAGLAGLAKIPCRIMNVDDNTAQIILTSTNLNQRQEISLVEKAKAYAIQAKALEKLGGETAKRITATLAEKNNESKRQIQRYVKVGSIQNDKIFQGIDKGKIQLVAAVKLSELKKDEQDRLGDYLSGSSYKVDLEKAQEIVGLAEEHPLFNDYLDGIFKKEVRHDVAPTDNEDEETVVVSPSDEKENLNYDKEALLKAWSNDKKRREFIEEYKTWQVIDKVKQLEITYYSFKLPSGATIVAMEHFIIDQSQWEALREGKKPYKKDKTFYWISKGGKFTAEIISEAGLAEKLKDEKETL